MYVVSGITGQTGRVVAEQLRAAGKEVRALVRNPDRVAELKKLGFEVRVLDLSDSRALENALEGAEGAYLLVPPYYGPGILDHQAKIAASIASALAQAKLPRAVLLSSIGAEHARDTGPIVTCHRLEQACADLQGVTFLRAAYFLENWLALADPVKAAGVLPNFLSPTRPLPMVATADIGRAAASLLLQETPPMKIVEIAGIKDPTPRQIADAMSELRGAPVKLETFPVSQVTESFKQNGVPEELAALFQELYQAAEDGRLVFSTGTVRRGSTPITDALRPPFHTEPGHADQARSVIERYFSASYLGDEVGLRRVFDDNAVIVDQNGAESSRDTFIKRVVGAGPKGTAPNYPFEKDIISLHAGQSSAVATASVRVGDRRYIDYLTLTRRGDASFLIERKAFEQVAESSLPQK